MKPSGTDKNKRHTLQWWMVPKCDEFGQWWWGYQKVKLIKHPEWSKWLYSFSEEKNHDG